MQRFFAADGTHKNRQWAMRKPGRHAKERDLELLEN